MNYEGDKLLSFWVSDETHSEFLRACEMVQKTPEDYLRSLLALKSEATENNKLTSLKVLEKLELLSQDKELPLDEDLGLSISRLIDLIEVLRYQRVSFNIDFEALLGTKSSRNKEVERLFLVYKEHEQHVKNKP